MEKIEDRCCDCSVASYPCVGYICPLKNMHIYYCDICNEEISQEYVKYGDMQLCQDCAERVLSGEIS